MQSIARIGLAPRRLRIKILTTRWMMTSIFFGATRADELISRCYTPHCHRLDCSELFCLLEF